MRLHLAKVVKVCKSDPLFMGTDNNQYSDGLSEFLPTRPDIKFALIPFVYIANSGSWHFSLFFTIKSCSYKTGSQKTAKYPCLRCYFIHENIT